MSNLNYSIRNPKELPITKELKEALESIISQMVKYSPGTIDLVTFNFEGYEEETIIIKWNSNDEIVVDILK